MERRVWRLGFPNVSTFMWPIPRKENNIAPRPLTEEEERQLFAIMPQRRREIAVFAINTGMRLGELRAQRWSDVDMGAGTLTVTLPKSGKHEVIPLNSTALRVLASADRSGACSGNALHGLADQGAASALVFPHLPQSMSRVFVRAAKRAGLEGITFHCLRDTYISRLAVTASPATLMALARHRNFRTTQRYLKIDDNHLRQAVESIVSSQNGEVIGTKIGTEFLRAV
jgi:integrase